MNSFEVYSAMNEMGFVVNVLEGDVEKAKDLAWEGFHQWNNPDEFPEYHDVGYAEPSMWLMDEAGIKYEISDMDWEDD